MCGGSDGTAREMIYHALHREYLDRSRRQQDVAADLGCTPKHLCAMVSGRSRVSAVMAARMERLGWPGEEIWLAQAAEEFNAACDAVGAEEPR